MILRDELEGLMAIIEKDLKAYYFKPPNISWGILFPLVLALSFSLRNPEGLVELAPGLIAMAVLFGTTSMEAIVITFEKRVGALERLFLGDRQTARSGRRFCSRGGLFGKDLDPFSLGQLAGFDELGSLQGQNKPAHARAGFDQFML